MNSVKLVKETRPTEIQIGQVSITDPEKVQALFNEYFQRARALKQITYSEIAAAIREKGSVRFNDGEDSILVKY